MAVQTPAMGEIADSIVNKQLAYDPYVYITRPSSFLYTDISMMSGLSIRICRIRERASLLIGQ